MRMFCQRWPVATFLAENLGGFTKPQRRKEQIMLREAGALTSEQGLSAGWLFAMDLTREEEQRSFLVTVKLLFSLGVPWRERYGQAVALEQASLMQNYRGVQAHRRLCVTNNPPIDKIDLPGTVSIKCKQWGKGIGDIL